MRAALALSVVLCALIAAGCGGGGGNHTYVLTPSAAGVVGARGAGIYLTIVSPVALPQRLFDAMRPKMTVVAQPAGPEVCSYIEGNWRLSDRYDDPEHAAMLTMKVSGSNPLADALCSGKSKAPSTGPTGASGPVELMGPTGRTGTRLNNASPTPRPAPRPVTVRVPWSVSVAPVVVTASQLRALSQLLNTPIYWVGPERGYRYQFSSKDGQIWVRYLPRGISAGATDRRFRIVGTYGGYSRAVHDLRYVAHGKATAGPRRSLYFRADAVRPVFLPNNVYIAFRGVRDEIEVFDPRPGVAAKIASTGRVRRVGG